MTASGPHPGSGNSPSVCVIGDGGGAHVRSRISALNTFVGDLHLMTPRPSAIPNIKETIVSSTGAPSLANFAAWRSAIRGCTADVVFIHYASSWGAWVYALMADPRPMVLTVMGGDVLFDEQSKPHPLARWLTRCVYQRADMITAKTRHLSSALTAQGVERARIQSLVWGIDTTIFTVDDRSLARTTIGIDDDASVIFSPRMLSPFYQIEVMIRAMAMLRPKIPNLQLLVSEYEADAAYRDTLKALVQDLGIGDAVRFVGALSPADMATHYRASDVAVGLPPSDGFPQTVFEAMACGCVNVVPPLSRYREFISDGETAIFSDPDPDTLATALSSLLSDPAMRARIAENGLRKMRDVPTIEDSANQLHGHIQTLCQSKQVRRLGIVQRMAGRVVLAGLAMRGLLRASAGLGT